MANFSQLLAEQKKRQDKDTVAISEAAQTFSLQIQKDEKLGQDFIRREGISNAAVSVVQNFQGQLDSIADIQHYYLNYQVVLTKVDLLIQRHCILVK